MKKNDPVGNAEWIFETIVKDFSQDLEPLERLDFYSRIAKLALERSREFRAEIELTPNSSDWVH